MRRHVPVQSHAGVYFSEYDSGRVTFEVRYQDSKGKTKWRACGPELEDAIAFQASIRVAHRNGELVASTPNVKFATLADEWLKYKFRKGSTLAPNTEKNYRSALNNHILPRFGRMRARDITADHIAYWFSEMDGEEGSKHLIYCVLTDVFKFGSNPRRGFISKNPCDSLEREERPRRKTKSVKRAMTREEIEAILTVADKDLVPVLQTALATGMRPSEVAGLRWDDIDFENNKIHCRWQLDNKANYVPTKGKMAREIDLTSGIKRILREHPTRFQGGSVFNMPYYTMSKKFSRARAKSGVDPELSLHSCRHTFASSHLTDGKEVLWVSKQLGHRDANMTLGVYAHVLQRDQRIEEASERLAESMGIWAR